jgi:hypothetical protein
VTQNDSITATGKRRRSAIDGRTTRHEGYGMSQSCRAMIECIFGWGKQHGTMRKTKHRGLASVATDFMLNLIAYNLIRIPKLLAAQVSVGSQHPDCPKPPRQKDGQCTNLQVLQRTARRHPSYSQPKGADPVARVTYVAAVIGDLGSLRHRMCCRWLLHILGMLPLLLPLRQRCASPCPICLITASISVWSQTSVNLSSSRR